eukprot:9502004-Pyramimonas_sp.AAC.1
MGTFCSEKLNLEKLNSNPPASATVPSTLRFTTGENMRQYVHALTSVRVTDQPGTINILLLKRPSHRGATYPEN